MYIEIVYQVVLFKTKKLCVYKFTHLPLFLPQHLISSEFDQRNPFAQRNVDNPTATETSG